MPITHEDSSILNSIIHSHLQWSTSQKQSILKGELTQNRTQFGVLILHTMCLIHHQISTSHSILSHSLPLHTTQCPLLDDCHLICCDQDIPLTIRSSSNLLQHQLPFFDQTHSSNSPRSIKGLESDEDLFHSSTQCSLT